MTRFFRAAILMACFLSAKSAFAGTYYIAANGSDANNGTSKATPWLHAPGMPNCTGNCASRTPVAGDQIIFRGGDTWHFGSSSAFPYVGGQWNIGFSGSPANCDPSDTPNAIRSSCIYIGVDSTWFSGSSWTRPIMTGDNPTSLTPVAGCAHPSSTFFSTSNGAHYVIVDNIEWTGMCEAAGSGQMAYINEQSGADTYNIYSNNYFHGWTHVPFSCGSTCFNMFAFNVRIASQSTIGPGNVCDGWDSDPGGQGCDIFGGYLIYDNVFGNMAQIVINGCHDSHDNLIYNYSAVGDGVAHGNSWECNSNAPDTDNAGHTQPNVPFNVYYNNIHMHDQSGNATGGDVKLWLCPNNRAAEYAFGNVMYDMGAGNQWNLLSGSCSVGSTIYKFNNTLDLSASDMDCPSALTSVGNHIIVDSGNGYSGTGCTRNDVVMTHSQAFAQGYMASGKGVSGNNGSVTCANDVTPCAPTSSSGSTVGHGGNQQNLCSALLSSTQSMIVNAGNACKYGTTDGCSYNKTARTVTCPGQNAVARPITTAWDAGAYQYSTATAAAPNPPTGLTASVQ
jgi:hypothetical protein